MFKNAADAAPAQRTYKWKHTPTLIKVIPRWESNGGTKYGNGGGPFQMLEGTFNDVKRITGDKYKGRTWQELRTDPQLAEDTAVDYLEFYMPDKEAKTGITPTEDDGLAFWYGGPGGMTSQEAQDYARGYHDPENWKLRKQEMESWLNNPVNLTTWPAAPTFSTSEPYTVKKGDILWNMSRAGGWPMETWQQYNPGVDPKKLRIGQTIQIPVKDAPSQVPTYTVQAGDTGMGIAGKHKIPWSDFQVMNPGIDWKKIRPGQKLNLAAAQPVKQ
jgi:LysM repeat protein